MLRDLRFRLRALFRRGTVERELDDELQFHLAESIEAHVKAGHSRAEAERLARIEIGGVEVVKEDCRDARGTRPLEDVVGDVRHGMRILRRSPAFTAIAVITLALGIGVNTAMFSLVDAVLRQPLPYPDPDQLVRLHGSSPQFPKGSVSFPNFLDWQAANHTFSAMAVSRSGAFTLTDDGAAERVSSELVSSDYFTVLGVTPLAGRTFARREADPGGLANVVIGERLWKRRFDGAQDVVGKSIHLDGKTYAVIGVVPVAADLRAVGGGNPTDVYVPIGQINPDALKRRAAGLGIHGYGRLAPGVTIEQARADLAGVTHQLATVYPDTNKNFGAAVEQLHDAIVGNTRPYVVLLFAAVALVLLIACVNVANLMLARSAGRAREMGIRLALGASTGRLVRQLLTESLLLAVAGGALGLFVAWWCAETLFAVLPPGVPHVGTLQLDARLLAFTAAISLASGVLAGLTPALRSARTDLHETLKEGGRGPSTTRYRAQMVFVILQMALTFALLVGAGSLVRTLVRLSNVDPGYDKDGVIAFGLSLSPSLKQATPERIRTELRQLETALATEPASEAMALIGGSVPMEADDQLHFFVDDKPHPAPGDDTPWAMRFVVGPSYLATMHMTLVRGRFFTARDDEHAPNVVVIDDAFAHSHFPGQDPVGKRIRVDDDNFADPVEIIGVVGHAKLWGLDHDETASENAQIYQPFWQLGDSQIADTPSGIIAMVRTRGETAAAVTSLQKVVQRLGAENVMFHVRTVDEIISGYQATRRFSMYVLAAFAALALLLSCVGIYGVVSYIVAQRTTEIGIRMALGARAGDILRLVMRQGAKLVIAGLAFGIAATVAMSPYLGKLVYGVSANDPVTFTAVALGVSLVAFVAIVLPARRAMRMDPMQALRTD